MQSSNWEVTGKNVDMQNLLHSHAQLNNNQSTTPHEDYSLFQIQFAIICIMM